jgi:toxin YoeB
VEIVYTEKAKVHVSYWKKSGNNNVMDKISALLANMAQSPYSGIGKPEALKHELTGLWSRRINKEHRIVYEVFEKVILIHSLKGHYS